MKVRLALLRRVYKDSLLETAGIGGGTDLRSISKMVREEECG